MSRPGRSADRWIVAALATFVLALAVAAGLIFSAARILVTAAFS